jgi:hypothetical protein
LSIWLLLVEARQELQVLVDTLRLVVAVAVVY